MAFYYYYYYYLVNILVNIPPAYSLQAGSYFYYAPHVEQVEESSLEVRHVTLPGLGNGTNRGVAQQTMGERGVERRGTPNPKGKGELTAVCRKPGLRTARHLSQKKDGGEGKGKSDVPDTHLLNPGKEPPPDPTWPHSPPAG